MLSTKQRAYLRSLANPLKPSLNFGKGEVDATFLDSLEKALIAHELIKVRVLRSANIELPDLMKELCEKTGAEPVNQLGHVLTLYKKNEKEPKIVLP